MTNQTASQDTHNSTNSPNLGDWGRRNSAGVVIASSLQLENISYKIGERQILDSVSFSIEPGTVSCLLGPSGSGKTSLLRIAAGLIEGASGSVKIDNQPVAGPKEFLPPEKRGIGFVFQDFALFPHLTILQNVMFGLTALKKSEAKDQALRILSRVGLEDRAQQYPHVLSGGEQQRVALARALAPRPGILLLDEPFSGLDSRLRDGVREETLDLLRETRSTAIIVTHDAEEALRVGDQIALMRDGKLVQTGSGNDIYYNPVDLFAAGFFSPVNTIPVDVSNGVATTPLGKFRSPHHQISKGRAAIRHTDVIVEPEHRDEDGVRGRIISRRFLGTAELLEIAVEGLEKPIHARIKAMSLTSDQTTVRVKVDPNLIMIFPSITK